MYLSSQKVDKISKENWREMNLIKDLGGIAKEEAMLAK